MEFKVFNDCLFSVCLSMFLNTKGTLGIAECGRNYYQCHQDCCLKDGNWFCDERQERCRTCDIWTPQCGNESLIPLGCLLFCHKIIHTPSTRAPLAMEVTNSTATTAADNNCLQWHIIAVVLGALVILLSGHLVVVCVRARYNPQEKWPGWLRVLLGLNKSRLVSEDGEADPKKTEEDRLLNEQPSEDFDADNPEGKPPKSSRPPSSASVDNGSGGSTDVIDFNINRRDDDDDRAEAEADDQTGQPRAADDQTPPKSPEDNMGPGQARTPADSGAAHAPTAASDLPDSSQQDLQAHSQQHPGLADKADMADREIHSKPVFNAISPTNDLAGHQPINIDPGTVNPAKNYFPQR